MVEDQDEKTINIKLPSDLGTLDKLNKKNKELNSLLENFTVDGPFVLRTFDVGSAWYVLLALGPLSYWALIGALKIAQESFKVMTEYYKSETAKIDYRASLRDSEQYTDEGMKQYCERRLRLQVDVKVADLISALGSTNGASPHELKAKFTRGVFEMTKQLREGTEFHLSLNPPEYVAEESGLINIDFEQMKKLGEEVRKIAQKDEKKLLNPRTKKKKKAGN